MTKLAFILMLGLFLPIFALISTSASANPPSKDSVIVYPVPDAVSDSPYKVTVGSVEVPIEKAGARQGAYYARFQAKAPVKVSVTIRESGDAEFKLMPERFRNDMQVNGSTLSFTVSESGPRVITSKIGEKHFWPIHIIVDDYKQYDIDLDAPNVLNVAKFLRGGGVQTLNIQKALDKCTALENGGVVYFPAGVYQTGTIRIKDNTTVYLAPGALIVGSDDPADYPVDEGREERGTHGVVSSFSRLIMFDNAENSKLVGYGVIDGRGHVVRNDHHRHVQLMDITASKDIEIRDIVLRNSAEWTVHILGCDNVRVDNLKIINDWGVHNTDGVNPDCSTNVAVTRYFGYCGDDAVAIKATGNSDLLRPTRNISFKDCVVMTRKTSYKVGTETYADISGVLFEDCEAVNSARGIGVWARDGGVLSNLTYRNIKLDLHEIRGEGMSGEPIRVTLEKRNGLSKVNNMLIEGLYSQSPYYSLFAAMPESKISNVLITDSKFIVLPREDKQDKKPVIWMNQVRNLKMNNTSVIWKTEDSNLWDGFISKENVENVIVEAEETKDF